MKIFENFGIKQDGIEKLLKVPFFRTVSVLVNIFMIPFPFLMCIHNLTYCIITNTSLTFNSSSVWIILKGVSFLYIPFANIFC